MRNCILFSIMAVLIPVHNYYAEEFLLSTVSATLSIWGFCFVLLLIVVAENIFKKMQLSLCQQALVGWLARHCQSWLACSHLVETL